MIINQFEKQLSIGIPILLKIQDKLNDQEIQDSETLSEVINACLVTFDFSNENNNYLVEKGIKRSLLK